MRVATGTPEIGVADCEGNAAEVIRLMRQASQVNAKVLVLPELCLTGYTAGDLFLQTTLKQAALEALEKVTKASKGLDMVTVVGLPLGVDGRLYNCAALVCGGALLGVVPKRNPPQLRRVLRAAPFYARSPAGAGHPAAGQRDTLRGRYPGSAAPKWRT